MKKSQVKITPKISKIAQTLKSENEFETVFNIIKWIRKNIRKYKNEKKRLDLLRKRTADEVIKSKRSSGCGDKTIVFISLAKAAGLSKVIFVETIEKEFLEEWPKKSIREHSFADVYIKGKKYIVDPTLGKVGLDYRWSPKKEFIVYKRGRDAWDIGINSFENLKKAYVNFEKSFKRSILLKMKKK